MLSTEPKTVSFSVAVWKIKENLQIFSLLKKKFGGIEVFTIQILNEQNATLVPSLLILHGEVCMMCIRF